MLKFSERQRAVHRQALQEIAQMVASSRTPQIAVVASTPSRRDHQWAERKIRSLTSKL